MRLHLPKRCLRRSLQLCCTFALACASLSHASDAPASQTALVTIHPEKPGLAIPADFLGFNCEKKILSRECFQPGNAILIALFRNLGPGVLQVGGNEVDSTSWSRTERTPPGSIKENRYSEKPSTIGPLSLDSLYAFAKLSG